MKRSEKLTLLLKGLVHRKMSPFAGSVHNQAEVSTAREAAFIRVVCKAMWAQLLNTHQETQVQGPICHLEFVRQTG